MKPTLFGPFKQLLSFRELPDRGPIKDDEIQIINNGGILVSDGVVVGIENFDSLKASFPDAEIRDLDYSGPMVALPSFTDCHTHICWGGNRASDYAKRVQGISYLDIAKEGGGIMDTVRQTRNASLQDLTDITIDRLNSQLRNGITTVEVKSGYGLTVKDEIKMLRAIQKAALAHVVDVVPTFLGAHIKPKDFDGSISEYLELLLNEAVPVIIKEHLAKRADIFIEEGAFDVNSSKSYIDTLKSKGFDICMHVDQFHPGGSQFAIDSGAFSADHLEHLSENDIQLYSNSNTVAVALPGASIGLGMRFTPCRKLLDANAILAIATDWNPGSAPMGDLLTQAAIIGAFEKLSMAETLAAITFRASKALGLNEGRIQVGSFANFTIFKTDDFRNILYYQGALKPSFTIKNGETYAF